METFDRQIEISHPFNIRWTFFGYIFCFHQSSTNFQFKKAFIGESNHLIATTVTQQDNRHLNIHFESNKGISSTDEKKILMQLAHILNWHETTENFYTQINTLKKDQKNNLLIIPSQEYRITGVDLYEGLLTVMVSQNANLTHYIKMLAYLAKLFGKKEKIGDFEWFVLPTIQELAKKSENDLKQAKLGYRTRYVYSLADWLEEHQKEVNTITETSHDSKKLIRFFKKIPGFGEYSARCTVIYALRRYDVIFTDRYIKSLLIEFTKNLDKTEDILDSFHPYEAVFIDYLVANKLYQENKNFHILLNQYLQKNSLF